MVDSERAGAERSYSCCRCLVDGFAGLNLFPINHSCQSMSWMHIFSKSCMHPETYLILWRRLIVDVRLTNIFISHECLLVIHDNNNAFGKS